VSSSKSSERLSRLLKAYSPEICQSPPFFQRYSARAMRSFVSPSRVKRLSVVGEPSVKRVSTWSLMGVC
jgi:hypothetical protein